jgi:hypothetical protein
MTQSFVYHNNKNAFESIHHWRAILAKFAHEKSMYFKKKIKVLHFA